ncbi:MAG: 16S rRNA (guanine(966)-N(2))-methyltransferase RsmD [Gammaproteobacteria bacterium]|jgi:16S rRNA (guanine966-N2)-methyltransferase|nr:16S rRNA (guanine(966)-N(2))-methyltransferase RsmD [Gammaproteobacteria bacterium]
MAKRKQSGNSKAGRLRIVAGNWRSRLLDIADVEGLRPTSERIRETLFNWLTPHLHGARCLDLYAGTGALGLEALSRGAASAVFVERDPVAERQLRKNIELLGAENAEIIPSGALEFLRSAAPTPFDIIFLDPPYAGNLLGETCRLLADTHQLADDALIYLEDERSRGEPDLPRTWTVLKDKTAGKVRYMLAKAEKDKQR